MRYFIPFFTVVFAAFSLSCGNPPPEREKLAKEVMGIHDEVMPKMNDIVDLRLELQEIRQNMENDTLRQHPEKVEEIRKAVKDLERADEAMMDWMAQYQTDLDIYTDEEAIAYLMEEKDKIKKVKVWMEESIEQARQLLEDLKDLD